MIRQLLRFLDARVLRLALVAACVWNCVLPSALYACRCTGGVHLQPMTEGCGSCAAKSSATAGSCCQSKPGEKRGCCQSGGTKTAETQFVAAGGCESGCCVELHNAKVPA